MSTSNEVFQLRCKFEFKVNFKVLYKLTTSCGEILRVDS